MPRRLALACLHAMPTPAQPARWAGIAGLGLWFLSVLALFTVPALL